MSRSSLSVRLLALAIITTTVAVLLTWLVISQLFSTFYIDRVREELRQQLDIITANLDLSEDGSVAMRSLSDGRYDNPLSGHYWQVQTEADPLLVSRSLWDRTLQTPLDSDAGVVVETIMQADEEELLALTWAVELDQRRFPDGLRITVANDLGPVRAAASRFQNDIAKWMTLLALALLIASALQVRFGLRPLESLRGEVKKLRSGKQSRLGVDFPSEVLPLVDEVNQLMDAQQASIVHAQNRTGDLAHGLKTPLTIIEALADEVEKSGAVKSARDIREQIHSVGIFLERELIRTRRRSQKAVLTPLAPIAEKMVKAIRKLPNDNPLKWVVDVPDMLQIPMDESDASELLGNLLDNARKHASNQVTLIAGESDGTQWLRVEDDGRGVPDLELKRIVERGARHGEGGQGYGLGLAIVNDLAVENDCQFGVVNLVDGGLSCSLHWHQSVPEKGSGRAG